MHFLNEQILRLKTLRLALAYVVGNSATARADFLKSSAYWATRRAALNPMPSIMLWGPFILALAFLAFVAGASASSIAEDEPTMGGIRVGFDGVYRVGNWMPVEVSLIFPELSRGVSKHSEDRSKEEAQGTRERDGHVEGPSAGPAAFDGKLSSGATASRELTSDLTGLLARYTLVIRAPDGDGFIQRFEIPLEQARGLPQPSSDFNDPQEEKNRHPISDSLPVATYRQQGEGQIALKTAIRIGRARAPVTFELYDGPRLIATKELYVGQSVEFPASVGEGQRILVVVGPDKLGLDEAVRLLAEPAETRTVVGLARSLKDLPTQWYAYEAVSAVMISFGRSEVVAELAEASAELEALRQWVANGGRLIVAAGPGLKPSVAAAGSSSSLAWLVPGRWEQDLPLSRSRTAALEVFAGATAPIPAGLGAAPGGAATTVAYLAEVDGRIEAADGRLPLVVRAAFGCGEIAWLALPLDQPPLTAWRDRGALLLRLVGMNPGDNEPDELVEAHAFGYRDLAGQLRSALDYFRDVTAIPFGIILLLMILHLALVGPADWWLVRWGLKRFWITWISFPLVIASFCFLAFALSRSFRGEALRINLAEVIDVDCAGGHLRCSSWASVFSPEAQRLSVQFQRGGPLEGTRENERGVLSWLGLPGSGFGGMAPAAVDPINPGLDYVVPWTRREFRDLPVYPGGTKQLAIQWAGQTDWKPIEGTLRIVDEQPEGQLINQTSFTLRQAYLLYRTYAFELGDWAPGQRILIGSSTPRRDLKGLLTNIHLVREKDVYRTQSMPYDRASRDVAYILQMMMFHQAAGGTPYTGLFHVYQGFVDATSLLKTNRAILVAGPYRNEQVDEQPLNAPRRPGTLLRLEGAEKLPYHLSRTCYFRFLVPIASVSSR